MNADINGSRLPGWLDRQSAWHLAPFVSKLYFSGKFHCWSNTNYIVKAMFIGNQYKCQWDHCSIDFPLCNQQLISKQLPHSEKQPNIKKLTQKGRGHCSQWHSYYFNIFSDKYLLGVPWQEVVLTKWKVIHFPSTIFLRPPGWGVCCYIVEALTTKVSLNRIIRHSFQTH